jgi:adenylate kinase family enzyme
MSATHTRTGFEQGKTRVVEIVGPAGAGKSTLCQLLERSSNHVQMQNFPDVRKLEDAPFFVSNGLQLIPGLFRLYRPASRHLSRREFAWLAILKGWSSLFGRNQNNDGKIIILDQGPVYLMAEMRLFGPEYLRQKNAERFWHNIYHRWKAALYMIVSLDAADAILMDRIRNRQQEHVVKAQSADVVCEFLQKYRSEYESLISIFSSYNPGVKVLKFDTGIQQPDVIAEQFLRELSCGEK